MLCAFSPLVPHALYGYGINRELTMLSIGDFPAPELQTIGNEGIHDWELFGTVNSTTDPALVQEFGYIPRYSHFKYMLDEVSGELRPGKTLDSFVLQRDFFFAAASCLRLFLERLAVIWIAFLQCPLLT